jgi:hypothetical protein
MCICVGGGGAGDFRGPCERIQSAPYSKSLHTTAGLQYTRVAAFVCASHRINIIHIVLPNAPAPMMARLAGMWSALMIWSDVMMRLPSAGYAGIWRGRDPVAMRKCRADRSLMPRGLRACLDPVRRGLDTVGKSSSLSGAHAAYASG